MHIRVQASATVIERPTDWLVRGIWQAPSWAIAAIGGAIVTLGTSYFVWRVRRARRSGRKLA
jgi:hypothetical protein